MADILDASGDKVATMGEDNKVRNLQGVVIGSVSNTGEVWSIGRKIGTVDGEGRVYEVGRCIGDVRGDGTVYDSTNHYMGKVEGGHIQSGGAALLLLVR